MAFSRKYLAIAVIVASLALLVYALFGSSDEERIMTRLKELASAVETREGENLIFRTSRLNKAFEEALEQHCTLSAPELPSTTGRRELAALAGGATRFSPNFELSLGETDVNIDGANARVVSVVTMTGTQDGELRREQRHVRFSLKKSGGEWRVSSIDVQAKSEDDPEARP